MTRRNSAARMAVPQLLLELSPPAHPPQPPAECHVRLNVATDVQPVILGTNARLAVRFGQCVHCTAGIRRGERIADTADGTAHVVCIVVAAR